MTKPDMIFASRSFMRIYAEEAEVLAEKMRLSVEYHVFGPNRLDRRKRKKLLRKARERGAATFDAQYGKAA